MKIIIIGAAGTIGKYLVKALEGENEIIKAGLKSGDIKLDMTSSDSVDAFFKQIGAFDALICTAGYGHFGSLAEMTSKDFKAGLENKLMGQVNLILAGQHYINAGGSFTLTSGILTHDPVPQGTNLSAINGAVEAFALSASVELKNDVRINVVSPGIAVESPKMFSYFRGHIPVSMNRITQGYVKSIYGGFTGKVIEVH